MPPVGSTLRRGIRNSSLPVGVVGGLIGASELSRRNTQRGSPQRRSDAAAIGGGAVGEAAWLGTGYGYVKRNGTKLEGPLPGQSRSQYQKLVRQHKERHGVRGLQGQELRRALSKKPEYFRTYPNELGGAKYKRMLGHMSGKRGALLQAATIGVPAGVAYAASKSMPVSKGDLRWHDKQVSAPRAVGTAAGVTLLAAGGSRIGIVQSGLAAGRKSPDNKVKTAAHYASRIRSESERLTRPLASHAQVMVHRHPGVGGLVDLVPAKLRPVIVAGVGGSLIQRSHPIRRDTYRPVVGVPSYGT